MAKQNNFRCSWTQLFTKAMNQLTSLHAARYPSHAKISKFLNTANNDFKHQIKSHTRGRPYNKQPRRVTNRLKHSQPHHSAQNSKRTGKSNGRQSCQTTTTSCRDRSPTPFPHKRNRINEDINNLSHLDTHSFDISTVTLEQNSHNITDSADLPLVQDHLPQVSSFSTVLSPKTLITRPFFTNFTANAGFFYKSIIPGPFFTRSIISTISFKKPFITGPFSARSTTTAVSLQKTFTTGPFIAQINASGLLFTNPFITGPFITHINASGLLFAKTFITGPFHAKAFILRLFTTKTVITGPYFTKSFITGPSQAYSSTIN